MFLFWGLFIAWILAHCVIFISNRCARSMLSEGQSVVIFTRPKSFLGLLLLFVVHTALFIYFTWQSLKPTEAPLNATSLALGLDQLTAENVASTTLHDGLEFIPE